jgi:hypothetical protein
MQRSGFDSRCYPILWEVMGLERDLLNLVSTTEELLGRKSSGSGLQSRYYGRRGPSRWPRGIPYPQNFALTSSISSGHSVGIVRSRTQVTEFLYSFLRHLSTGSAILTYETEISHKDMVTARGRQPGYLAPWIFKKNHKKNPQVHLCYETDRIRNNTSDNSWFVAYI